MQPAIKFNPLSSHHTKYIDLCPRTKWHNLELSNDKFISQLPPHQTPPSPANTPLTCWSFVCALPSFPRRARRVMTKTSRKKRQLTFCTTHIFLRAHTHTHTHTFLKTSTFQSACARHGKTPKKKLYGKEKQNVNEPKVREAKRWEGESERVRRKNLASVKSKVSRARSAQTHTHTRTWCGESHSSVLNNALGVSAKVRTKVRESGEREREVSEKIDWRSTPRKEQRASAHWWWAVFLTAVSGFSHRSSAESQYAGCARARAWEGELVQKQQLFWLSHACHNTRSLQLSPTFMDQTHRSNKNRVAQESVCTWEC